MKKSATLLALSISLFVALVSFPQIGTVKAEDRTYIDVDGNVVPATAPIQRIGDVYTLTGDVERIVVDRSNMILDGNGYQTTGASTSGIFINNVNNVTIKNHIIKDCEVGIMVDRSTNITVSNNTITGTSVLFPGLQPTGGISFNIVNSSGITGNQLSNNYCAIAIVSNCRNNDIFENNITNSSCQGIGIYEASDNTFYHNNFINNTKDVYYSGENFGKYPYRNNWDNGSEGNYWSNYNGTDTNGDGIGDTPYVLYENNQDNYPLMNTTPEFPLWIILALFLTAAFVAVIFKKRLTQSSERF
jgi:parallel beta-helix repeat protein